MQTSTWIIVSFLFIHFYDDQAPSFPSFFLDVLCDPNDFIWRAMTGRTAIIDSLLAEIFRDFPPP